MLRDADSPRHSEGFNPRSNVDGVAVDVVLAVDDVPNVDSYADLDLPVLWPTVVHLMHRLLNVECAPDCFKGASELDQEGVPDCLDFSAVVLWEVGSDQASVLLK